MKVTGRDRPGPTGTRVPRCGAGVTVPAAAARPWDGLKQDARERMGMTASAAGVEAHGHGSLAPRLSESPGPGPAAGQRRPSLSAWLSVTSSCSFRPQAARSLSSSSSYRRPRLFAASVFKFVFVFVQVFFPSLFLVALVGFDSFFLPLVPAGGSESIHWQSFFEVLACPS